MNAEAPGRRDGPGRDEADTSRDTAGIPIPPPFIYLIPFLAGVWLHHTVGGDAIPEVARRPAWVAGWALVVLGVAINASAWVAFLRAKTPVLPTRPTTAIVTGGPYRFTRNPLYLSLALIYAGVPLVQGYLWPYLFLPLVLFLIVRLVIEREERYLERKFGSDYTRYRDAVRRWI